MVRGRWKYYKEPFRNGIRMAESFTEKEYIPEQIQEKGKWDTINQLSNRKAPGTVENLLNFKQFKAQEKEQLKC